MTWRDKLEIGLKEDAPYRKDNLPKSQVRGPVRRSPEGPGRSPVVPAARARAKRHAEKGPAPRKAAIKKPSKPVQLSQDQLADDRFAGEGGKTGR